MMHLPACRAARGFTLLEVMVALAIAATALVVLIGRVGSSADIQRDLAQNAEAIDIAVNQLEAIAMQQKSSPESNGEVETPGGLYRWTSKQVSTLDAHFVRQNIEVTAPDGSKTTLFLYRNLP